MKKEVEREYQTALAIIQGIIAVIGIVIVYFILKNFL